MKNKQFSAKEKVLVWLTTNKLATLFIRKVASRLDPVLFKLSNGRLTSFGPPQIPMLTLTAIGKKSGQPRSVQVACVPDGEDFLIVASAMGQEKHPAWKGNIEANPNVKVQLTGQRYNAVAKKLTEDEKKAVWHTIKESIPQIRVYESRTDRDICVFRLCKLK